MLSSVLVDDVSALAALEPTWATLAPSITIHPAWQLPWWDVFGGADGRALRAFAFYDGRALVGLAPLLARRWVHRPRIAFRRLEALASGEDEADEICSVHLGLVARPESERAVAEAFAEALANLGTWDELVVPRMTGGAAAETLQTALASHHLDVTLEEVDRAPVVSLPKTDDAYLASLGAEKRARLERAMAALEAWAGGTPTLERVDTPARIDEGLEVLETLHRAHHPDGGVYRSSRFRAFHQKAMPRLFAAGALDVGWLRVHGRPIAAFYNLRWRGRASHYQSGHASEVPADANIGVTLQALLVRAAIEDGLSEYDFLGGVLDYKMALTSDTRPLVTLRAARPSLRETARRTAEGTTRRLRALLRR